jgi:hypothetical protein
VLTSTEFAVIGQIATRHGVQVSRAAYTRGAWDPGIEVFASTLATNPSDDIRVAVEGISPASATPGATDPTGVWKNYFGFIEGDFARQPLTLTNISDPLEDPGCLNDTDGFGPSCESSVVRDLFDSVTITEAYHYRIDNMLEIVASTSDEVSVCPDGPAQAKLTAYADDGRKLGDLTPGIELIISPSIIDDVLVPPARVTVKSCFGGSDTEAVDIGLCERAGNSQECVGGVGKKK